MKTCHRFGIEVSKIYFARIEGYKSLHMKTFIPILLLATFSFLLAGCPVNTKVPFLSRDLALPPDASLLGTWKNKSEGADIEEMKVTRGKNENCYHLEVMKSSDAFFGPFAYEGWLVSYKGYTYLVTQAYLSGKLEDDYYVQQISKFDGFFYLHDFVLDGVEEGDIKSGEELRNEVVRSRQALGDQFLKPYEKWVHQ